MSISNSPTETVGRVPNPGADAVTTKPPRTSKRAPTHPGAVVADILDEQQVSLRSAAAAIGMSPTGLGKVLRGESPVTPETALLLAAYLGNDDPVIWLRLQADYDLWHARVDMADRLNAVVPLAKRAD